MIDSRENDDSEAPQRATRQGVSVSTEQGGPPKEAIAW